MAEYRPIRHELQAPHKYTPRHKLTVSQVQLTMAWSALQPAVREDAEGSCWPNVDTVEEGVRVVMYSQGRWSSSQGS